MIKYTVQVEGMMCGMCESHVNDVVRKNFDVKKVTASHSKNEVIIIAEEALDENKLKQAIRDTGYDVGTISQEPYTKKCLFWK